MPIVFIAGLPGWVLRVLKYNVFIVGITFTSFMLDGVFSIYNLGGMIYFFLLIRFLSISRISCSRDTGSPHEKLEKDFPDHNRLVGWKKSLIFFAFAQPLSWELVVSCVMDDTDLLILVYGWCSQIKWWRVVDEVFRSGGDCNISDFVSGLKYGDRCTWSISMPLTSYVLRQ